MLRLGKWHFPRFLAALVLALLGLSAPADVSGVVKFAGRWKGRVSEPVVGVAYGPFRPGQRPGGSCPGDQEIQDDLLILTRIADTARTYGLHDCDLGGKILSAAQARAFPLFLGLSLGPDRGANAREIRTLKSLAARGLRGVRAVVVGNETLLRGDLPMAELVGHVAEVRKIIPGMPLTVAEPWHIWLGRDRRYADMGSLARTLDFLSPHIHPYWEGVCLDRTVDGVLERFGFVQRAFPGMEVHIGETGWPSGGEARGCAVPALGNQRVFLWSLLRRARAANVGFFAFEAFDEPWKAPPQAEAHWGLYTARRLPKNLPLLRGAP